MPRNSISILQRPGFGAGGKQSSRSVGGMRPTSWAQQRIETRDIPGHPVVALPFPPTSHKAHPVRGSLPSCIRHVVATRFLQRKGRGPSGVPSYLPDQAPLPPGTSTSVQSSGPFPGSTHDTDREREGTCEIYFYLTF